MYTFNLKDKYNREDFVEFLRDFLPDDFEPNEEELFYTYSGITEGFNLGVSKELDLTVLEFYTESSIDKKVTLTKEVASLMKKYGYMQNALVVFFSKKSEQWRLSLVTTDYELVNGKSKAKYSNPRRYSFLLGNNAHVKTPEQFLFGKGKLTQKDGSYFNDLKERFSVEALTKQFYSELFTWYEWACVLARFPLGKGNNVTLSDKENQTNMIRLITRLMFVWFIKQKDLVPNDIFDESKLNSILNSFTKKDATSTKKGNYYNAILQNLFFATLNKAINDRAFADLNNPEKEYGVNTLYRDNIDSSYFKISQKEVIKLFRPVPFLNGGLFECLDKLEDGKNNQNVKVYIDGFSREKNRQAFLPNALFFNKENDDNEGLISILNRYNFTVEENTATDVQVALDPELLGKVFENLLGTYNPETKETARKDSGSFYTPREIVSYMVNESLIAYLGDTKLVRNLFNDSLPLEKDKDSEYKKIEDKLKKVKIFDPACGSGAFPMGMLHALVNVISRIDSKIAESKQAMYDLKLYLIENCIYGADIQSIAVQISKLRFFISLICEQDKTNDEKNNYGFNPLPNLETKFVSANTLLSLKKKTNRFILFTDPEIGITNKELKDVRHKHFSAKTSAKKRSLRNEDKNLRDKLISLLKKDGLYAPEDALQYASWDPYNQNEVASFFDAEWMFGVSNGFDIVIGNPPYVSTKGVTTEDKQKYETEFGFSDDTYNLFTFKGMKLLSANGSLSFITPKTFWTTQTKRNMRDLILSKNIRYIFDTANPFESAMVDTCITQIVNTPFDGTNEILFLDGSKDLKNPFAFAPVKQQMYINTQNSVIFKPTEQNLKIWQLYGEKVKDLYNKWWDKIETSKKITQNSAELKKYRESLKPGDIVLLGALTEGGVGLQTGNNGKYIAVRKSTKWAKNIVESRPKKLAEAVKRFKIKDTELDGLNPQEFMESKSEQEIAAKFDALKEKYGRDIFGQGYIFRLIDDSEMADIETLTEDEKANGIDTTKNYYVPYDKGDKDGNRWYLETPFAIAWSKENVQFLKTNSGKKGAGMPVVRNPQFNFKEGLCWSDINTTFLKCRQKQKSINDVKSMSLYGLTDLAPEYYIICLINSKFMSYYVDTYVNNTQTFQINDARQLPIIIPNKQQLNDFRKLFDRALNIKKSQFNGISANANEKLQELQEQLDLMVENLYSI